MGFSHTQEETRHFITNPETGEPIDLSTLKKYFAAELAMGKGKTNFCIAQNVARTAMSHTHKDAMKAAIFHLTHQAGWSSQDRAALDQVQDTADQRAAAIIAALAGMDATIGAGRAVRVAAANGHVNGNGEAVNGKAGTNGHEGNGTG